MSSTTNLKRWYNVNKVLPMNKENKFWLHWEKNKLFLRRLKYYLLLACLVLLGCRSYGQIVVDSTLNSSETWTTALYIKCDTVSHSDTIEVEYAIYPDSLGYLKVFHPKYIVNKYRK